MIRVLIVDDHGIMREGLKQLFSLSGDIEVAGEASNGAEALETLRNGKFDLLMTDLNMPGLGGIDLIIRIRAHDQHLPILALSMYNEPQVAKRVLKAGAFGYVSKDSSPKVLLEAVRKVAGGGRFLDPSVAEKMAFETADFGQGQPHEQLSNREFHIFRLLARGKSLNEIADELSISNKTVSTHKARLMEKMGFASNADLVRYAVAHELSE
jgi:DNA-binding NarL/FixJ family response regulator